MAASLNPNKNDRISVWQPLWLIIKKSKLVYGSHLSEAATFVSMRDGCLRKVRMFTGH